MTTMPEHDDAERVAWARLTAIWSEMRNDAGPVGRAGIEAAVEMALDLGAVDANQAELWRRRSETCPGHESEGGRAWCAYCGDMPKETT